jgi:hypothetical protein
MKNSLAILRTIGVLALCGMALAPGKLGAQTATYQLDNASISSKLNASDTTEPHDNWFANEFTALAGANVITRVDFGVFTTTSNSTASVVLYRVTDPGGDPALGATRVYTQSFAPLTGDGTNAFLQPINLTSPVTFNVGDRFLVAVFISNVIAAPPNDVYPYQLDTSGIATGTYWDRSAPNTFNLDDLSQARPINQAFVTGGFVPGAGHIIIRAWSLPACCGTWALDATSGPSPRQHHAMAYDSARGVVVLFGGSDSSSYKGDTWEWNGAAWTLKATTGPSPRNETAMAYDSTRGVIVLFGGGQDNNPQNNSDTWEWDGATWTLRSSIGFIREVPAWSYAD